MFIGRRMVNGLYGILMRIHVLIWLDVSQCLKSELFAHLSSAILGQWNTVQIQTFQIKQDMSADASAI